MSDQFAVVQSRIDDAVRASPSAAAWIADPVEGAAYAAERFDASEAGKIADEEIADLRGWLDKRWDATPRDTRILMALLKHLPGGKQLTRLTEAAPYLLTLALIVHHTFFGMDLVVLGGYSIATWLTEKLSNEVSGRTRSANQRIADRFTAARPRADPAHLPLARRSCAVVQSHRTTGNLVDGMRSTRRGTGVPASRPCSRAEVAGVLIAQFSCCVTLLNVWERIFACDANAANVGRDSSRRQIM